MKAGDTHANQKRIQSILCTKGGTYHVDGPFHPDGFSTSPSGRTHCMELPRQTPALRGSERKPAPRQYFREDLRRDQRREAGHVYQEQGCHASCAAVSAWRHARLLPYREIPDRIGGAFHGGLVGAARVWYLV